MTYLDCPQRKQSEIHSAYRCRVNMIKLEKYFLEVNLKNPSTSMHEQHLPIGSVTEN